MQQRLTELRNNLLTLHKILLDSERATYEREVEKVSSPGQLFTLVVNNPWFAYLHEISRLVVEIDEAVDDKKRIVSTVETDRFVERAKILLVPAEQGESFQRRYYEALQRDPDVVLAHGAMMRALSAIQL